MESIDSKNMNSELITVVVPDGDKNFVRKNLIFEPKNKTTSFTEKPVYNEHFSLKSSSEYFTESLNKNKSFLQKQNFYYAVVGISLLYFASRFFAGILFNI